MPKKTSNEGETSTKECRTDPSKKTKESKKNTSLRLDKQTLKALKIHAIENDTSVQQLIESLVTDFLKKEGRLKSAKKTKS